MLPNLLQKNKNKNFATNPHLIHKIQTLVPTSMLNKL
mgnify:CR=1 FL=1